MRSIRFKTNEKGGQLNRKLSWKLMQNGENWCKILKIVYIRPTLCQCISGTKCETQTDFFCRIRSGCTVQ